jgi:hypothetical protein
LGFGALITGCSPVEMDMTQEPDAAKMAAAGVRIYTINTSYPEGAELIRPIEVMSCQRNGYGRSSSSSNAIQQLQVKALEVGANAVVNVTVDSGGVSLLSNCWNSVTAAGTAARIR